MLEALGLHPDEQSVYESLVDGPAATAPELSDRFGLDPTVVAPALSALEAKGLVARVPGMPARYTAVAPELTLDMLALQREEQVKRARLYIEQLSTRFHRAAGSRDPAELVEVVTGRYAVQQRAHQIGRSARQEFRGIDKPPYANPKRAWAENPFEPALLHRGVRVRVIYDGTSQQLESMADFEASVADGEQARLLPSTPTKLFLADDRIALLPLQAAPTAIESAVVVHPSALLEALGTLFEILWERALPIDDRPTGPPRTSSGCWPCSPPGCRTTASPASSTCRRGRCSAGCAS